MNAEKNTEQTIRLVLVVLVLMLGFGYLVFKLWEIQVERNEELTAKAKARYVTSVEKRGLRGTIFDGNQTIFAGDAPYFSLQADPCNFPLEDKKCPHVDQFKDPRSCPTCKRSPRTIMRAANFFSRYLGLDRSDLIKLFSETTRTVVEDQKTKVLPKRYVMVAKKIDFEDGKTLREKMKAYIQLNQAKVSSREDREKEDFSGVFTFNTHYARMYPRGSMLSNIIGFVNVDRDKAFGISGLERSLDSMISPHNGRHTFETTRRGAAIGIADAINEYNAPVNGTDIHLTVSEPIQTIIEEELDLLVEKYKPKLAYCIVVDPKTGNIMALAQRPTFDPNDRATYNGKNVQNLMAENIFEPGSTMKPLPVAYALDRGVIGPNSTIFCENGYWSYGGKPLRDTNKYGQISIHKIIQVSSNIGTAKIALELGNEALYRSFKEYGFGEKTNLPLKPESRGILPNLKRWSKLSATRLPIGQGIVVTPFQMVRAYSALANNGLLPSLRLIDYYVDYDQYGRGTKRIPDLPPPKQMFNHPETTCKQIREMMKAVCMDGGTAKRAAIPGYYAAGKTGTAQKVINGQYSYSKHVASFIGFAPADDPRFVMLVSVDEPQGVYYGGVVSAPVFSSAGARILKFLNVKPDYVVGSDQDPNEKRRIAMQKTQGQTPPQETIAIANPFPEKIADPDDVWTSDLTERDPAENLTPVRSFDYGDLEYIRRSELDMKAFTENPNSEAVAPPLRLRP